MSTVKLLHHEKEGKINGDQEGCRLGLKPAPDESYNSTGKGTSGMDKLAAKFTECTWSLEASFLTL